MGLLIPLDENDLFGDLPDLPMLLDTFRREVDAIETELGVLDQYAAAAGAAGIADIFLESDTIASTLDGLITEFDGFDFSAPLADLDTNNAEFDSFIGSGNSRVGSAAAVLSGLNVSLPNIGGIKISPPGAAPTPPTLPPPIGVTLPPPGGGVNGVTLTGSTFATNANVFHKDSSFVLTVTGPRNVPVYAISAFQGHNRGQADMGTIDSTGHLVIRGMFTAADVGEWIENWYVGNVFWGHLQFNVA